MINLTLKQYQQTMMSDRLYFDEITFESVMDIAVENCLGVILS